MMEDTIMIRLSFDDDVGIPNPSQKSKKELNQFWFNLQPQQHTAIAHINAHILHTFQLHRSCPLGIHLYVDGFPLLPNESTGILSISDTISVRKNRNTTPVPLEVSREGGDATSKKRKSSAKLPRKDVEGDATTNKVRKSSQRKVQSGQVKIKKPKVSVKLKKQDDNGKDKPKVNAKPKKRDDNGKDKPKISTGKKRSDDIQKNANSALEGTSKTKKQSAEQARPKSAKDQLNAKRKDEGHKPVPVGLKPGHTGLEPGEVVAIPKSRSARRKKMKRQKLQELKKQWQQESEMQKFPGTGERQSEGVARLPMTSRLGHSNQPTVQNPCHQQGGVRQKQASSTNTTNTKRIDGFALPPFESTGILNSSDMISVRKKTATLSLEGNREGQEARVAQPVKAGTLLLANHEFQEETGDYLSDGEYREPEDKETDKYAGKDQPRELEEGEIGTSKKRKASANIHKSKKKKRHSALQDTVEDDATANQVLKGSRDKVPSSQENIQKQESNPKIKKQAKNGKDKITNSSMEISTHTERKKKRHSALQEDRVEDDATANKVPSSQENIQKQECNSKIKKQAKNGKDKITNSSLEISTHTERSPTCSTIACSSEEIQINANDTLEGPMETKKISRSSRRKKAKRQWLRQVKGAGNQNEIVQSGLGEILFTQLEEQAQPKSEQKKRKGKSDDGELKGLLHWKSSSSKDSLDDERKNEEADRNGNIHEQDNRHSNTEEEVVPAVVRPEHNQCNNQQSDAVDEVVPVVIRPGHIRFEPLDKDEDMEHNKKSGEHFTQWNGITNKKKGQKWGKQKHGHSNSYSKDYYETQELDPESLTIEDQMEEVETEAFIAQDQTKNVGAGVFRAHNELHLDNTVDFDKLPALRNLPKAGGVIVYRLLELSSSWTPELSPFRVGKVSWSSPETGKLLLLPVPVYPISSKMLVDDDTDPQPDNSFYNEDGSLEIDFASLVDVRLLNDGSGGPTVSTEQAFGLPMGDAAEVVPSSSNDTHVNVSTVNGEAQAQPGNSRNGSSTENGVVDVWEQVSAALNAKKAELSQERTGNTWSYRTLKGSALGPTMALLRSNKKL